MRDIFGRRVDQEIDVLRRAGAAMRDHTACDLHPDGKRLAVVAAADQSNVGQDKVVFVFNFVDYLRTIAPGTK